MSTAGAPKGNGNALIASDSNQRRALCLAYISHISNGLSDSCFPECSDDTIRRYIEHFPEDFPIEEIKAAKRLRQAMWEQLGLAGAAGRIKGFSSQAWKFNMQNRFGWKDASQVTVKKTDEITDDKLNEVFWGFMGEEQQQ